VSVVVAGLVLAAGSGSRMGRPKAAILHGQSTFAALSCQRMISAGLTPVRLVLGAAVDDVVAAGGLDGVDIRVNDEWATGMSSSLRVGLHALAADAVIVNPVDTPMVSAAVFERLARLAREGLTAAVATYDGVRATPVMLSGRVWAEVLDQSSGDEGARGWLRANSSSVIEVPCEDIGSGVDLDTAEELAAFRAAAPASTEVDAEDSRSAGVAENAENED